MHYAIHGIGQPGDLLSLAGVHDLSMFWEEYVTARVRDSRVLTLSGRTSFSDGKHRIEQAVGVLELNGGHVGAYRATLQICFSDAAVLPPPAFTLAEGCAVGTLTVQGHLFHRYIGIAGGPRAHFRIGGDGSRNALAADVSQLP